MLNKLLESIDNTDSSKKIESPINKSIPEPATQLDWNKDTNALSMNPSTPQSQPSRLDNMRVNISTPPYFRVQSMSLENADNAYMYNSFPMFLDDIGNDMITARRGVHGCHGFRI